MKNWLQIYFGFTKRELNGVVVLMALTVLLTAAPYVYDWMMPEKDIVPEEMQALKELLLMEAENSKRSYRQKKWASSGNSTEKSSLPKRLFKFDPNTISTREWQMLGLSERQAAVMCNYVGKGGRFYQKEDLQKMYVISAENYERLAPYIYIAENSVKQNAVTSAASGAVNRQGLKSALTVIGLNTADTLELQQIKGIGPAFARRIVNYRERLGGFYAKEQLKEVFGVDSTKYEEIKDQVKLDSRQLTSIAINKAGFEDLRRNPYLSYKQINAIIQYRKQHGNYSNIADLKKVAILPAATVDKLVTYISFEHD